jgi:uncharacterized membrane protein (DUF485 family)
MSTPGTKPATSARESARRRFGQLLKIMLAATALVLLLAFAWLDSVGTPLPAHLVIAVSIAVAGSLMLAAALMGLVFFSNASGADRHADPASQGQRPPAVDHRR